MRDVIEDARNSGDGMVVTAHSVGITHDSQNTPAPAGWLQAFDVAAERVAVSLSNFRLPLPRRALKK